MVTLRRFLDPRGNLSVIEQTVGDSSAAGHPGDVPFKIERCYWVYDVPGGDSREGHGYRRNEELIVALSGSLEVACSFGGEERVFHLSRCYEGVYVPAGVWRELRNFSTNSVALVVASRHYEEYDYFFEKE